MKLTRSFYVLVILLLCISIEACKTKKIAQVEPPKKEIVKDLSDKNKDVFFKQVIAEKNTTDALSFSSEAEYKDDKQSATINIEVQAKRNQYIFLNAKAFGIVNVARVMISPDSIRILDLINRKYISASYRFMQSYSTAPIGFEQLQNMVWANAMFDPKAGNTTIDSLGEFINLIQNLGATEQKASYSKSLKTQSVVLTEQAKMQEMRVKFGNFKWIEGIHYPHQIVINITGEKKVDCTFTINNFAPIIRKEPQFVVPKSYKVQVY
ncbi:MAG: hypothetical protein CFE21_05420 [Bacteroidetes bacterium B1(2017)]|nr:MAG: hypothetical protein CFE21_05420 [Bacteroidetes bacterium B1(2017)]